MKKVLFICMGNICRSSMAEGILREKIRQRHLPLSVDSAGTHDYHHGNRYDARARATLREHHIDVEDLRSRPVCAEDFQQFDTLFAADRSNIEHLAAKYGDNANRVELMTAYSPENPNEDVPDPYYGGEEGFHQVYVMLDAAIEGWLATLNEDA